MTSRPHDAAPEHSGAVVRSAALLALALSALPGCYWRAPEGQLPVTEPRALAPRDIARSHNAWEEALGADSLFRPRITRLTSHTIGVSLARPAHVAVIQRDRCGPYASVPGRDLTRLVPEGVHYLPLVPGGGRSRCWLSYWLPYIVVVASELPMHGEVLADRARDADSVEELMAPRRDRWAMYLVYYDRRR